MPRPKLCLCPNIKFKPKVVYFKPQGISIKNLKIVELSTEEVEACRLSHVDNLEQHEAAKKMHTSQSTYQRILHSANKKITDALINGKAIKITKH